MTNRKKHTRKDPCIFCEVNSGNFHREGCKAEKALSQQGRGYKVRGKGLENMITYRDLERAISWQKNSVCQTKHDRNLVAKFDMFVRNLVTNKHLIIDKD